METGVVGQELSSTHAHGLLLAPLTDSMTDDSGNLPPDQCLETPARILVAYGNNASKTCACQLRQLPLKILPGISFLFN